MRVARGPWPARAPRGGAWRGSNGGRAIRAGAVLRVVGLGGGHQEPALRDQQDPRGEFHPLSAQPAELPPGHLQDHRRRHLRDRQRPQAGAALLTRLVPAPPAYVRYYS